MFYSGKFLFFVMAKWWLITLFRLRLVFVLFRIRLMKLIGWLCWINTIPIMLFVTSKVSLIGCKKSGWNFSTSSFSVFSIGNDGFWKFWLLKVGMFLRLVFGLTALLDNRISSFSNFIDVLDRLCIRLNAIVGLSNTHVRLYVFKFK